MSKYHGAWLVSCGSCTWRKRSRCEERDIRPNYVAKKSSRLTKDASIPAKRRAKGCMNPSAGSSSWSQSRISDDFSAG